MDDTSKDIIQNYRLDEQIGFRLRLANQKHLEIFSRTMGETTPTQLAVLAKLFEVGDVSQNHLGRLVGMDAATTKGVVERLVKKDLIEVRKSETDRRRLMIRLSAKGLNAIRDMIPRALEVSAATTANLTQRERERLAALLDKL